MNKVQQVSFKKHIRKITFELQFIEKINLIVLAGVISMNMTAIPIATI